MAGAGYSLSGSYFESCNCDPICPCRMTDGIPGGRSTFGICFGALSWLVEEGHVAQRDGETAVAARDVPSSLGRRRSLRHPRYEEPGRELVAED